MKTKESMEKSKIKNRVKNETNNIFYKTNPSGISLIVLVITIIVIIILATAVIVTLVKNNPIESAIKAVDDSNVSKYTEQIEQIRSKLMLQDENYELPKLQELKEELEKEKWVSQTEMIMDEGIEKLKVVTKEGYIFYITEESIEYKGKGEVVDTSALKKEDVIELKAEEETEKGQYVRITNKAEEYYEIKYKIGEEEEYKKIKSGERVEVEYGKTIYARLVYGSSEGIEHKLKIGEKNPSVVAKNIETNNMKRKTEKAFAELFDITWGSEGVGQVRYEVAGNLVFKNKVYSNKEIENIKELELGTYNIKCIITSESGYEANAVKQVKVTALASTSILNENNSSISANAIYSEYDLAYFRDVVNNGHFNINGKLMNDINLVNVCSVNVGDWVPIGICKADSGLNSIDEATIYYNGIFDGNNNKIQNIYINNNLYRQCLFAVLKSNAIVKNVEISGNISGKQAVAGICGWSYGTIKNCINKVNLVADVGIVGGIVSRNDGIIENCMSNANLKSKYLIGGIAARNQSTISDCYSKGTISSTGATVWTEDGTTGEAVESFTGGIVGHNYGITTRCVNKSAVTSIRKVTGGIAGRNLRNYIILL